MSFYQNSKIYKIVDNTNGDIYVGSTCKRLCQRLAQHRASYKCYLNGISKYITSFKILKNNDYDIILLEECKDIQNIEQLRRRERFYIESLSCVNKVIVGRSLKEYREDNKEAIKQYRDDHKEYHRKYCNDYYEINKDHILHAKKVKYNCNCGGQYTYVNKAQHCKTKKHLEYLKTLESE